MLCKDKRLTIKGATVCLEAHMYSITFHSYTLQSCGYTNIPSEETTRISGKERERVRWAESSAARPKLLLPSNEMIPIPFIAPTRCLQTKPLLAPQSRIISLLICSWRRCDGHAIEIVLRCSFAGRLSSSSSSPAWASSLSPFLCILHADVLIQAIQLFRLAPGDPHWTALDHDFALECLCRILRVLPVDIVYVCAMCSM